MATPSNNTRADDLLASYAALGQTLMPGLAALCLFDDTLALWEETPGADAHTAAKVFRAPQWHTDGAPYVPVAATARAGELTVAIPMLRSSGRLLAVLCAQFPAKEAEQLGDRPAATVVARLKPALDCLH